MNTIAVNKADYLEGYKVLIYFTDKTKRIVDFESFLLENPHPQYNRYINLKNFRKFKIENGNIVWGSDWDLVFPVYSLYTGNLLEPGC